MGILVVTVLLTIFISAQCSLYEATLYSTRMGALEAAKSKGNRKILARRMIRMKEAIAAPISAILILNTLANTAGATIAGMYAHQVFGAQWVPAFSVGLTLAILFLAEIGPKTLGAVYWRAFWPLIVWPLTGMRYALYPAVYLTQQFSNLLTKGRSVPLVSEEEILGIVRLGAKEGEISRWESDVVQNIIKLENQLVREVMTPRKVVFELDGELSLPEAFRISAEKEFSRIPVYEGDRENVIGYVMKYDLCSPPALEHPEKRVATVARPIAVVRDTANCLKVLMGFLKDRRHIAVVEDEFGGLAGVVTLEDLLETVLGEEIVDETDREVDLQKAARRPRGRSRRR